MPGGSVAVLSMICTTNCPQAVWRCNTRFRLPTTPRLATAPTQCGGA